MQFGLIGLRGGHPRAHRPGLDARLVAINGGLDKLERVGHITNQRGEEMGNYLSSRACDRPAEGQIIKTASGHSGEELSVVRGSVERLRRHGASGSAAHPIGTLGAGCRPLGRTELDNVKAKVVFLTTQLGSLAGQCQATRSKLSSVQLQAAAVMQVPSAALGFCACGAVGAGGAGLSGELAAVWAKLNVVTDGNLGSGARHCLHVSQLNGRVRVLEFDCMRRGGVPTRTSGGATGAPRHRRPGQ